MPEQCQENYANLVSAVLGAGFLIFSEVLPFIKAFEGNGLIHSVVAILTKKFAGKKELEDIVEDLI